MSQLGRARKGRPGLPEHQDGQRFGTLPKVRFHTGDQEITFNAIRALAVFKGKLYTSAPTGATGQHQRLRRHRTSMRRNEPGFGKLPDVATVYDLAPMGGHLLRLRDRRAGAVFRFLAHHRGGFEPPVSVGKSDGRRGGPGALNQGAVAMQAFRRLALNARAFKTATST